MKSLNCIAMAMLLLAAGCQVAPSASEYMTLAEEMDQRAARDSVAQAAQSPAVVEKERTEVAPDSKVVQASFDDATAGPDETTEPLPPSSLSPVHPPVVLETGVMTLADLEAFAMQNNPALSEAASRIAAARGNWEQVGLPPNPNIGYSGQQLFSNGAEQNGGYISQEFIRGNKLGLNQEVAAWRVQKSEQELAASTQRVLTDVRIGYYNVLIAQRRKSLAGDLVKISEQGEQAADALFRGEEVSEADPLRARVEAETARILLQNAVNQHEAAWRRLAAVLGATDLPIQELAGDLNPDQLTLSWQETLQRVLSESPEMGAAHAEVEATRWAIQRACAEVVPDVEVQAVIQDDRGTGGVNTNLQVTFPLPLWNRNQGGIHQAFGDARAAERTVDRLALQLQSRLAAAFRQYENARNQVHQYSKKDGILDNTKRSLDLIRKGYEVDEFGVIDLLSAQRTYFETSLAYLDSQQQLWVTATEIQGLLLKDSLSQ